MLDFLKTVWDFVAACFSGFFALFIPPQQYNTFYVISFILTAIALLGGIPFCFYRYHNKKNLLRTVSYGAIFCVFFSALVLFYPLFCAEKSATPWPRLINALFLSAQSAIKIFFGDFDIGAVAGRLSVIPLNDTIQSLAHLGLVFVSVLAPCLAIGCLIGLVHRIYQHKIVELLSRRRDIFVFNELTPATLTLAKSIYNDYKTRKDKKEIKRMPRIVFCDVFDEENEKSFNLLSGAREINGVCYKDDLLVVDKKLRRYYCRYEDAKASYFLIGDDETENVYQACKLAETYDKPREKTGVKRRLLVYVSAVKECNICVLDSLTFLKGEQLKNEKEFNTFAEHMEFKNTTDLNAAYAEICDQTDKLFDCAERTMPIIIKRIDPIKRLVWKTLLDKDNFLYEKGKKTLPILITGISHYGLEFLKALCWFYQLPVEDFSVDIHIVDQRKDLREYLMGICPELIAYGEHGGDGEARFRITLHSDVDVFGGKLERVIRDTECLHEVRAAFVCLGDDAVNTEIAMKLRSLFLRYNPDNAAKIFAVVYDNVLHNNLQQKLNSPDKIKNGGYRPYNITFIGALESLYNYKELQGYSCLAEEIPVSDKNPVGAVRSCDEQAAFFHHFVWSLSKAYTNIVTGGSGAGTVTAAQIAENFAEYCNFEYYRLSSLATCMHQYMLSNREPFSSDFSHATFAMHTPAMVEDGSPDDTPELQKYKKLEHARWNCYMRADGFIYSTNKSILGKTHYDLCHYDDLDPLEHLKDSPSSRRHP